MRDKKGSALIWILVIFVLIVVGVVIYLVVSGSFGGGEIPTPPALPDSDIGGVASGNEVIPSPPSLPE